MKKTIKKVVFTLLMLSLGISAALLLYLHFFESDEESLSGEWSASLDMTEQAAVTAFGWLQDIEGVSVSLEDVQSDMPELTMQVNLTFEQTGRSSGSFQSNVSPESYDVCRQTAYEAFVGTFQEILAERLRMAGYTGSMDEEALEALVTETFGMSTEAYLMSYAPGLLPSLEELQAQYDGSGTYETAEDVLTRQFEDGAVTTRVESYICNDSSLILIEELGSVPADFSSDDYPVIYTLKQPTD
ncbi:MAG: hypothetical protein K2N39_04900 [Lachnospiraceae bacterium]|nr:hypothetical protein [Lachnospiraceae bacterium]